MFRFTGPLLLFVVPLGGCNVARHETAGDANVSIHAANNGQVSFDLPFAKGEVKLPQGTFANGHFDIDGVKMIPGGSIHGFTMNAGDKGGTVQLAFNSQESPEAVRAYFLDQFKQKGDEAALAGNAISGKTRKGDSFLITVEPTAAGSTGTIAIQSKD
ncbi:MAG TPA: hypothetical protein VGU01_11835 [Sphingomicrobium sp.]|nr:hypothetical protein [Sphingomicrobium sp.]